jgi:hypothetical protein
MNEMFKCCNRIKQVIAIKMSKKTTEQSRYTIVRKKIITKKINDLNADKAFITLHFFI